MRVRRTSSHQRTGAFTLLESLIASAVLAIVVLAVGASVTAAQRTTMMGRDAVLAAMAADDLLSELVGVDYIGLDAYDGLVQPVGGMQTLQGEDYPRDYTGLGRSIIVQEITVTEPEIGVVVLGKRLVVACFDNSRVIAELETFVPEPAS